MSDFEYLEDRVFADLPIYASKVPIYPPHLIDIFNIGEKKYYKYINNCVIDKNSVSGNVKGVLNFDILLYFFEKEIINVNIFLESLEFFTKHKFEHKYTLAKDDQYFVSGNIILSRANYDSFVDCIKIANCISNKKEEKYKKNSELDRKIQEAKRKIEEKLGKKQEKDNALTLRDLISVLAANSNNTNMIDVWKLNIYQFDNQFKRMQMIDNYNIGIRSLLAGAKREDIKLDHYISKINK